MLKPLIRTIPNLSGNVKIACSLSNFEKNGDVFECVVRYARLLPISNVLANKQYEVNLLNSTYEFDLMKYYKLYSNIFYETQFNYAHNIYNDGNPSHELKNRDKDFEFGVKRISYKKNGGSQFAFFAPIWIENSNDIPDYFLLRIDFKKHANTETKTIKIKINDKERVDKFNYLSIYLNKYAKNLKDTTIFCTPLTNQATYYGIDLERGGFVKKVDNIIGKNYRFQSSIDKFDLNITEGFKRNKLCIKQTLPLCFMFSTEDILNSFEIDRYSGAKINITGAYYKDNKKANMYDFSTDYTYLGQKSWLVKDGKFEIKDTMANIMDMDFPSLREASYIGYEHFNKIQKESVRWKLKYSSDEYPYITNMSPAFSMAQNSTAKYREYPSPFIPISVYNDLDNNIVSPLHNVDFYKSNANILRKYAKTMQNNASNWFNVIENFEDYKKTIVYNANDLMSYDSWYKKISATDVNELSGIRPVYNGNLSNLDPSAFENIEPDEYNGNLYVKCSETEILEMKSTLNANENISYTLYKKQSVFDNNKNWADVIDNKVYFKGVLYDLSKIYKKYPDISRINKFGIFVKPNLQPLSQDKLNGIKTAHFAILTNKKYAKQLNAVQSTHLKGLLTNECDDSPIYMSEASIGKRMNEVSHNSLFIENNSNTDGNFLDLAKIGYNVYELNKYYALDDILKTYPNFENIINSKKEKYVIDGYYLLPIYRLSQVSYDKKSLWFENSNDENCKWLKTNLFFNLRDNHNKSKYDKKAFTNIIGKYYNDMLECPLFIESKFVSAYAMKQLIAGIDGIDISSIDTNCKHYMFNPILVDQNESYAMNIFTETKTLDMNYGDYFINDKDIDFICVDPYNMANVLGNDWNSSWLEDDLYSLDLYAKFLNKTHLKLYIGELYKNENGNPISEENKINHLYVKRRILFNDSANEHVYLKDLYINLTHFYSNDNDYKDIARKLLKDLIYDEESNTWHFSDEFAESHDMRSLLKFSDDDMSFANDFELVFNKRFLKVNELIWNKISINNHDQFTDLYLFRISREDDYPSALKYQCTSDLTYLDIDEPTCVCKDTCFTLQPLFTSVFMKSQASSTIYAEYNQSKISCTHFNDDVFYRYDSDNAPLVIDISDIDITNNLIYGANNVAYYSYSYLDKAKTLYDADEVYSYYSIDTGEYSYNLSYMLCNKKDHLSYIYNGTSYEHSYISYLPTLNMVERPSANIMLAYGTEQVLEYYSVSSYNYIAHNEHEQTSYYSDVEHTRINFDNLKNDLHIQLGEHSELPNTNPPVHTYSMTYYEDDVHTFYDVHSHYVPLEIEYDDLGLYDEFGISTYISTYAYVTYNSIAMPIVETQMTNDGLISYDVTTYVSSSYCTTNVGYCVYGLMCIDAKFNNTNTSVNMLDTYNNDKKYFDAMNGHSIYDSKFSIAKDFIEFVPFINFSLFNAIDANYIVKPFITTINAYSCPIKIENSSMVDIATNKKPLCNISLERYFDSITPLITEVTNVKNTYMLKLENSDTHTIVHKERDESTLYKENININSTNGTRLYSGRDDYERVFQIEEKHFNDNYNVNLESKISIKIGDNLTYEEVIEAETYENVLMVFSNYIKRNGSFDDNEILFLYNKYDVSYDSYSTGIDYDRICKTYTLTIIFNLR